MSGKQPRRIQPPDWPARFEEFAGRVRSPMLKRFYGQTPVDPDTPLADVPFVAMDFETSGLDPRSDSLISIGLVPMNLERIRLSGARYWVVKPRREMRDAAIPIHNITHQELKNAPDLVTIVEDLLEVLAGTVVVVHYRGIERRFLDVALHNRIGEGVVFPMVDTMELEARVHQPHRRGWVRRLLRRPRPSIRLAESRERYHLPLYRAHHALTDALATAELLQAQVAYRYRPDTPIRKLWC